MSVDKTIVIVGPTASGKTALAVNVAEKFNGEIISADSRAIYKYMDIGTAKPTTEERSQVRHYGINLVEPDERYTASDFKSYAIKKIALIRTMNKQPFLVGGSGLYVDSVIYDYQFGKQPRQSERDELNKLSIQQLQSICRSRGLSLPENSMNRRYLIRTIEIGAQYKTDRSKSYSDDFTVVGIKVSPDTLRKRIEIRAEKMFSDDIVKETTFLVEHYGWDNEAMKSNIYAIAWRWIQGKVSREEAIEQFITDDWHLAKKQMTWFQRNKDIIWLELDELREYLDSSLST